MKRLGGGNSNKHGAIELSVGTIVVVVLAMSMLILGLFLIRGIFSTSQNAVTQVDSQLKSQLSKMFGEEKKLVIYPDTGTVDVRQGKIEGFAIGIKNLGGVARDAKFSYEVSIPTGNTVRQDCGGVSETDIMSLVSAGSGSESDIGIASGDAAYRVVLFDTNTGDPLCTVKFKVDVKVNGQPYQSGIIFVTFKG
jgi:hypothetical protein